MPARQQISDSYSVLRTRGIAYDAEIALRQESKAIELRVLPEVEATPPRYRVILSRIADDNALTDAASVAGLVPGEDGFVAIYFDSSRLAAGRYRLTITGDAGTTAATEVSAFRIRLLPASQ